MLARGDDERVLRIGRALVENAMRHTPPGTGRARIGAETLGGLAVLVVVDNGPGIAADEAGRSCSSASTGCPAGGAREAGSGWRSPASSRS